MREKKLSPAMRPVSRRDALQAGAIGLLGLSSADVTAWRSQAAEAGTALAKHKTVIYLFLTGGASQHDTFDMKPEGPVDYKGEFNPIATNTPGIEICEHMPMLAQRSHLWSLVRSLTHKESGHDRGTYVMLTGSSVYQALGIPEDADWHDVTGRPYRVYQANPIAGLMA